MTLGILGHRDFDDKEKLEEVKKIVVDLIENQYVDRILFGSRSEFTHACYWAIVDILARYPHVEIYKYCTRSETAYLKEESELANKLEAIDHKDNNFRIAFFDGVYYNEKFNAGKVSYLMRDKQIVKDSQFLIMYYNKDKAGLTRSGTSIMFRYAKNRGKTIFNVADKLDEELK